MSSTSFPGTNKPYSHSSGAAMEDFVVQEIIDLSGAPVDGLHHGATGVLPDNCIIDTCHIEVLETVSGGDVDNFTVGVDDSDGEGTEGTSYLASFVSPLTAGDRGLIFNDTLSNNLYHGAWAVKLRVYTRKADTSAAATTAGSVKVTVYGRKFTAPN